MKYENKSIEELIKLSGRKKEKIIRNAFNIAQKNIDKENLIHSINTAFILAEQELDIETIIAALLHHLSKEKFQELKNQIETQTNKEAKELIEEIINESELIEKNKKLIDLKILGQIVLATSKDIRSIFVRLASSLERIRKINEIKTDYEKFLVKAIKEVHTPIAHKLGLYDLEWQLNDFCFKAEKPREYKKIKELLGKKREEREKIVKELKEEIKKLLEENNVKAIIEGRVKSFSSIYKKMEKGRKFNEIDDLIGVRIITETISDCYKVLGIINEKFNVTGHFHDFIANPKENNYQSIHTVIIFGKEKAEIQIRTKSMHLNAELGSASHWKYKQFEPTPLLDEKLSWAKQLVDWQKTIGKKEFINSFKIGFEKNKIFAFTPKKEIIILPEESCVIDFAFAIHTQLGLKCSKAFANNKIVPLTYKINNGDEIKIIKSKKNTVKESWLNFVKTTKAKNKIRQALGLKISEKKEEKIKTKNNEKIIAAECCNPLPGDQIIAFKTTKRKIKIHRINCKNINKLDKKRIIKIKWVETKENYPVKLRIKALNKPGILIELLDKLAKEKVTLNKTTTKIIEKNLIEGVFEISTKNRSQLEKIIESLENSDFVLSVKRE